MSTNPQQPPPLPAFDAKACAADLIARAKPLDIGSCLSRGWTFYTSDFWPILGVTLLAYLIMSAVPAGGLFAMGLGMAGLYYYYLGKMRGQTRQLPDIFVGLSRMTGPLIIGNLAMVGLILAIYLAALLLGAVLFLLAYVLLSHAAGALVISLLLTGLACFIAAVYVTITLSFMFPLIIDKNLAWRDAMTVSRRVIHAQFWRYLGLKLALWMLSLAGLMLLIVGVYFVIPLMIAAIAHAYEDLCNPPEKQ